MIVYGDSNCLDSAHLQRDCFWLLDTLLKYATTPGASPPFTISEKSRLPPLNLPQRMEGKDNKYSCKYTLSEHQYSIISELEIIMVNYFL